MKEIDDEDADRCPVCNIDLGCDPEEKLRCNSCSALHSSL
jgi:E3 ubiquitin-protein ligase DRIP